MARALRIAVVAACPFPARRGTPVRVQRLSEALAARGHRVKVFTYSYGDGSSLAAAVEVSRSSPFLATASSGLDRRPASF